MTSTFDANRLIPLDAVDPLDVLEAVARGATALDPVVARLATMCVELARERRLEIEARLVARLQELSLVFAKLDEIRGKEIADRELQYQALSTLIDVARASGDPQLIVVAMQSFQEYVRSAPALTRDFGEALKAVNYSLDPVE